MKNKFTSTPPELWDSVAETYNEDSYEGRRGKYPANSFRSEILLDYFAKSKKGKVLDAGCGTGHMTRKLLKLGWDVTSVDYSEGMLKVAKQKTKKAGLNGNFSQCSLFELEKLGEKFDYIMLNGVLPYIEEEKEPEVFNQIKEVLKKDGVMLSAHYNIYFNLLSLDKWTPLAIEDLAKKAGIKNELTDDIFDSTKKLLSDPEDSVDDERTMKMEDPLSYGKKISEYGFRQFDRAFYNFSYLPLSMNEEQSNSYRSKMEKELRRDDKSLIFFRGFVSFSNLSS